MFRIMNMRRAKILTIIGITLTVLGAYGWASAILSTMGKAFWISSTTEVPLGELTGIAVDNEGRIYCGAASYSRIQVYSRGGQFLRGWHYSGTVEYRFRINDKDQLEVADAHRTRRGDLPDILTVFDANGKLIASREDDGCYDRFGSEADLRYYHPSGSIYLIRGKHILPRIYRITTLGKSELIVQTAWCYWPIMAPLPAWFMFIIGLLFLRFASKKTLG